MRAHLATCPDEHAEIAELGSVLPALDASVPVVEPPAAVKARILAAAAADLAPPAAAPIPVSAAERPRSAARARSPPWPRRRAPTAFPPPPNAPTAGSDLAATWALRIAAVLVIGVARRLEPPAPATSSMPPSCTSSDVATVSISPASPAR